MCDLASEDARVAPSFPALSLDLSRSLLILAIYLLIPTNTSYLLLRSLPLAFYHHPLASLDCLTINLALSLEFTLSLLAALRF